MKREPIILQNRIIKDIISIFEEERILRETDVEEFLIWRHTRSLSWIINDHKIAKADRQAAAVSLGIMYINMSLLYAKFNLTPKEFETFLVYILLNDFNYSCRIDGYANTEIIYTKHADIYPLLHKSAKIDIKDCKVYEQIKDVVGLSDFDCYYYMREDLDDEQYYLVPKFLSQAFVKE